MAGVEVTGLRKTVRNLEKAGADLAELKEVMARVGAVVATEVKAFTPVLSGRLRGSVRVGKAKAKATVRAGSARVPYAGVQNFGGYNNIRASHFMEKGVDGKQGQILQELDGGLQQLIDKNGL